MMNSGSDSNPAALSHKPSSAAHSSASHFTRSPRRLSSNSNKPSSSPSPRRPRDSATSALSKLENGRSATQVNGYIDSDTETAHLSAEDEKKKPVKKTGRKPDTDRLRDPQSPALTTRSEPLRSVPSSRRSSMDGPATDKKSRRANGVHKGDDASDLPSKSSSNRKSSSHQTRTISSERAQSAEATLAASAQSDLSDSTYDNPDRERKALSVEPRKRKFSDESHKSKLEPPRQRPRLDSISKASPRLKNRAISPPSPLIPEPRSHKRSTSLQSASAKGVGRKKREVSANSQASDDKSKLDDDSSDDSSTNASRIPSLVPPRSNRTASRALASPMRTTALHSRRADKYGTTPLAKFCERGQLAKVIDAYEHFPEELDQEDNGGFAPLQKAALGGHVEVVKFLLDKGCRRECCSKDDRDTPLIDAVENGHIDVIKVLLSYGVNPHHANKKGVRAIDAIDWNEDEAEEIELLLKKAMAEYQTGEEEQDEHTQESPVASRRDRGSSSLRPDLLYQAHTKETLLKYSTNGDLEAVGMFLESVVPDNACVVAAARGGHDAILSLLLASAPDVDKDPDPIKYEETPLLAAIGRSNLKVIRLLLDQDNFNPCRKTRDHKTYYEVAEERKGPRWQAEAELLKERYDAYKQQRSAKKKRIQDAKALGKSTQSTKDKELPQPKSPRLSKMKPPKLEKSEEERKTKRLSGSKETTSKDTPRRKRHIIEDDSQEDVSSDNDARQQSKVLSRKRGNSISSKLGNLKSGKVDTSSSQVSPKTDEHHKGRPGRKPKERKVIKTEDHQPESDDIEMRDATSVPSAKASSPDVTSSSHRVKSSDSKARRISEARAKEQAEREEEETQLRIKEELAAKVREREEEERRKREAERKKREEEEIAERKRKEREERLASLPLAIRHAIEKGRNRPLMAPRQPADETEKPERCIYQQFLPLHIFPRREIDPDFQEHKITSSTEDEAANNTTTASDSNAPNGLTNGSTSAPKPMSTPISEPLSNEANEIWTFSFHAVGILGLSELYLTEYPTWPKLPVTADQRTKFLPTYDIAQLAMVRQWTQMGQRGYDHAHTTTALDHVRDQFRSMQPLYWIRLQDLRAAIDARPDLARLKITTASPQCFKPQATEPVGFWEWLEAKDDVPVPVRLEDSGAWVFMPMREAKLKGLYNEEKKKVGDRLEIKGNGVGTVDGVTIVKTEEDSTLNSVSAIATTEGS
jgi:ankyrin repeat protein